MKSAASILFLLISFISSQAQQSTDSIPSWYKNPLTSISNYYGAGIGSSWDMEIAEKKAILNANLQIAEQVEAVKVKEVKEKTANADGTVTEKTIQQKIIDAQLSDVRVIKKEFFKKDREYTVYILLMMKKENGK